MLNSVYALFKALIREDSWRWIGCVSLFVVWKLLLISLRCCLNKSLNSVICLCLCCSLRWYWCLAIRWLIILLSIFSWFEVSVLSIFCEVVVLFSLGELLWEIGELGGLVQLLREITVTAGWFDKKCEPWWWNQLCMYLWMVLADICWDNR